MTNAYIHDKTFDVKNTRELPFGEYERCNFKGLNFSQLDLSQYILTDCTFVDCNLTMTKFRNSALRKVKFEGCKIMGVLFDECNNFGFQVSFSTSNLINCTFTSLYMTKTIFEVCDIHECDFTATNLSESRFLRCSLVGSTFERTNLEKVDFRLAEGFIIDPEKNKLRKAQFENTQLSGLLKKYQLDIENL